MPAIDKGLPAPWLPGSAPPYEDTIIEGSLADHSILAPGQDRIWAGVTAYADDVFTTRLGGGTP